MYPNFREWKGGIKKFAYKTKKKKLELQVLSQPNDRKTTSYQEITKLVSLVLYNLESHNFF